MQSRFILAGVLTIVLGSVSSACSNGSDGDSGDGSSATGAGGNATGGSSSGSGGSSGATSSGAGGQSSGSGAGGSSNSSGSGGGGSSSGGSSSTGGTSSGPSPMIGDCAVFPPEDAWNTDISGASVDTDWTERLQAMVGDIDIHPDYGSDGADLYGIPINVVPENQAMVDVTFDDWPEESDPGPYPFPGPGDVKIEGNDAVNCDGDCHVLVVQQGACMLYEGFACHYEDGWHCANGAVWDLTEVSYGQRPDGWTSADAAGLAITPGILRYDEVAARDVRHAIRFTVECTQASYVPPATHQAVPGDCNPDDPDSPPMGLRVRLAADFDASGYSDGARAVITAMQKYGMILADNGSNFYFQGEAHPDWNPDEIEELKTIPASAFEVVTP